MMNFKILLNDITRRIRGLKLLTVLNIIRIEITSI
jgi:hypothetical protein